MAPVAHLLFSWLTTVKLVKNRRERALVSSAGVLPDIDGIGLVVDWITDKTNYYAMYHHYIGHSIYSALLISTLLVLLSKTQRKLVFLLSFFLVHFHIFLDIIGSKGPDGNQWPVYYLYPVDSSFNITWSGQWELNAWQNQLFMLVLLIFSIYIAVTRKLTFLEIFSEKLNQEVFSMYNRYVSKRH
ncbi:metal-dependent hydrolase [Pseudoalteromonas luteoviolacea]|uniref:metal-dependent hydrolase n=1 Tax=Pseudoalteromonas luteoviolacea TaxID=43657 RepID=UPI001FFD9933|nr:metal-dependent hydrolase [Pseudoalteromonas luteoviolacea]